MSRGCIDRIRAAISQSSSAVFGSADLAPRSLGKTARRSPMTLPVTSWTVASTPPMPPEAVSSGTGLWATVKCVSSNWPVSFSSRHPSSFQVEGPPRKGVSISGLSSDQTSLQQSLTRVPSAHGCFAPRIGR